MGQIKVYTSVATVLLWIAIAGHVHGYQSSLTKAERVSLKTALIASWLQHEIARTEDDAICNPSKYTDPKLVLTKYKLSWMINPAKTKTFIYIPDSFTGVGEERVFISDSGGHAEDYMISKISTPPIEFWITNTPCPCCARKLMAWYSNSILKAEIHATRFFADAPGRPQEKNAAIDCLAKMMAQGFTIVSWDWLEFHESFIRNAECSDVLKKAAENEKMFEKLSIQYEILGNALNEARKRSQTQNWLDNISNKCVQLQC